MAEPHWTSGLVDLQIRSLNARAAGAVDLFTTEPTYFVPLWVLFGLRRVAGFVAVPTIALGTSGPNWNNILTATAATGISTAGQWRSVSITSGTVIPPSTLIRANVTVAANAATYDADLHLIGVYV